MKRNFWIIGTCCLLLLFLGACSDGNGDNDDNDQNNSNNPPPVVEESIVKLFSSDQLEDGRWEYHLGFLVDAVKDSAADLPFYSSEYTGYAKEQVSDADNDGYYDVVIRCYNRAYRFWYGETPALDSPAEELNLADYSDSKYYEAENNNLAIEFFDGEIYAKNVGPILYPPGNTGDEFIRASFDAGADKLTLWFNNNQVDGSVAKPFYTAVFNSWLIIEQDESAVSGWGRTEVDAPESEIYVHFGGDLDELNYVDASSSILYDEAEEVFHLCFDEDWIVVVCGTDEPVEPEDPVIPGYDLDSFNTGPSVDDDTLELTEVKTEYSINDSGFFAYVRFAEVSAGSLTARILVVDPDGKELVDHSETYATGSETWYDLFFWDFVPINTIGEYAVKLFINEVLKDTITVTVSGNAYLLNQFTICGEMDGATPADIGTSYSRNDPFFIAYVEFDQVCLDTTAQIKVKLPGGSVLSGNQEKYPTGGTCWGTQKFWLYVTDLEAGTYKVDLLINNTVYKTKTVTVE